MLKSIPSSRQSKLQANLNLSQREWAKALSISLGGAHYCLQALLDKDLIKIPRLETFIHGQDYSRHPAWWLSHTPVAAVSRSPTQAIGAFAVCADNVPGNHPACC